MTKSRHVVVTGAASGIGAAVAAAFKQDGARVTALDRHDAPEADTSLIVDLSDTATIDAALEKLADVVVLCNVAGVPGTLPDENVFAVNFLGMRHLTDALLPRISDGGAVVNVASTAGFGHLLHTATIHEVLGTATFDDGAKWFAEHRPADVPAYNFSKEVVILYTGFASVREWHRGVRVNAVSPGPVETPILASFEDSMGKDVLDGVRTMVGRHGRPDDIAPLVEFLASPASRWVNGQNLIADGGFLGAIGAGVVPMPI